MADVEAETLFEATVMSISIFRQDPWLEKSDRLTPKH